MATSLSLKQTCYNLANVLETITNDEDIWLTGDDVLCCLRSYHIETPVLVRSLKLSNIVM